MSLDWTRPELLTGLRCYRNGEFFAAHEHWEIVWLQAPEPDKTFLQALIQLSAALHHLQRGNFIGALSLLTTARRRLSAFGPEYAGVAVAALITEIDAGLSCLETAGPAAILNCPHIRIAGEAQTVEYLEQRS